MILADFPTFNFWLVIYKKNQTDSQTQQPNQSSANNQTVLALIVFQLPVLQMVTASGWEMYSNSSYGVFLMFEVIYIKIQQKIRLISLHWSSNL